MSIISVFPGRGKPKLQNKSVTPSTSIKYVQADSDYDGLEQVIVSAIQTQEKSVAPSTSAQSVTPDSGKFLSKVTVGAAPLQSKSVTPTTSVQTVKPDSGQYGLSQVSVGAIQTQEKSVAPSTSAQSVTPDSGKFLSKVTVKAEKAIFGNTVLDIGTKNSGQTIIISDIIPSQYATTPEKVADILFIVCLVACEVSNCYDADISHLELLIQKNSDGSLSAYTIAKWIADGRGSYSNAGSIKPFEGTVTLDTANDTLTIKISDYYFTRLDGYNMEFSVSSRYDAMLVFRDYPTG